MSSHTLLFLTRHLRQTGIISKELLTSFRTTGVRLASAVAEETGHEEEGELKLAPSAIEKLTELQNESPGSTLRVTVEGGGCSGFQYKFALDDQRQSDDILFEQDGAKLLCDKVSLQFLKGSTVEFADTLMKSAFQIKDNPNSEASCGCGTSFSAKM